MKRKYFYLHTNGELIEKNAFVVESEGVQSYFNSPFVVKYWIVTTEEDEKSMLKNVEEIKLIKKLTNSSNLEGERSEHLSPNKENKNNG